MALSATSESTKGLEKSTDEAQGRRSKIYSILCLGIIGVLGLGVWYAFDHHIPTTDESGHIMACMDYANLYSHARPFNLSWWHKFLTVSSFYPPTFYVIGGFLKLVFSQGRVADVLAQIVFFNILTISTYKTARFCNLGRPGSIIASLIVCLSPAIFVYGHYFLLDLPLAAAVAFGFAILLKWQSNITVKTSILTGLAIGAACLTKQLVACYLLPLGFLLVLDLAVKKGKNSLKLKYLAYTSMLVVSSVVTALPWALLNYKSTLELAAYNRASMAQSTNVVQTSALQNFTTYLSFLGFDCTPFLLIVAAICLFATRKIISKNLFFIMASVIAGIGLISLCSWCELFARYTMCAAIPVGLIIGSGLEKYLKTPKSILKRITLASIFAVTMFQWLTANFCPYPLRMPSGLLKIYESIVFAEQITNRKFFNPELNKIADADLVMDAIAKEDNDKFSWLNVMVNEAKLNAHTFELLVKERKTNLKATTSLQWTISGDKVRFDAKECAYYKWYLFKTGNHGYKFFDKASETNYLDTFKYMYGSGLFVVHKEFKMAGGDTLILFKQKD